MQSRLAAAIWMRFVSQCTTGDVSSSFRFLGAAPTLLQSESAILFLSMSTPVSLSKTIQLPAVIPKSYALFPSFSHPSSSACPFVRSAEYAPSAAAATSCPGYSGYWFFIWPHLSRRLWSPTWSAHRRFVCDFAIFWRQSRQNRKVDKLWSNTSIIQHKINHSFTFIAGWRWRGARE
jgi:hypothetical protein